jgi:hypothetical protein
MSTPSVTRNSERTPEAHDYVPVALYGRFVNDSVDFVGGDAGAERLPGNVENLPADAARVS